MVTYEKTSECRMAFLQESLDDDSAAACGRCDSCAGVWFPTEIPQTAVTTARGRLERAGVELESRAQWPSGMDRLGVPVKGKIKPDEAMETGRAVARLTDLGWGQQLRTLLRAPDAEVTPELLRACVLASDAQLVSRDGRWRIDGDPTEGALVVAASKVGFTAADLNAQEPRVGEIPFSSERRRMTTLHTTNPGAGPAGRAEAHLLDWRPFQVTVNSNSEPGFIVCAFELRSALQVSEDQYLRAPWSM
jgi:hypothetical protein